MGVQSVQSYCLVCDHTGCEATCPHQGSDVEWFVGDDARRDLEEVALGSGWVHLRGRWLCPDHWTLDDDDETVEVTDDDRAHPIGVTVDPVVVTCAVRYAFGRGSYLPSWIADTVRSCWGDLGDQQEVIREDVRRWLVDELPESWTVDRDTWEILDQWMAER